MFVGIASFGDGKVKAAVIVLHACQTCDIMFCSPIAQVKMKVTYSITTTPPINPLFATVRPRFWDTRDQIGPGSPFLPAPEKRVTLGTRLSKMLVSV